MSTESSAAQIRYRSLLEAAPDAMVVIDAESAIVMLNRQAECQFGYQRDELVGQQVRTIIPAGFDEPLILGGTRSASEAQSRHIVTGLELTALRKDGTEFPVEIVLSPLESADGMELIAAIRDISERREAERHLAQTVEELRRSNEELEQFAYVASHDLQEPLRMVSSYTQLLANRYQGRLDTEADEFIGFAVDGAHRMQRLIQDLLLYCHVGTTAAELVPVDSGLALGEAITNLAAAIEDSGATITWADLPEVMADQWQLVQLFQNLVGNAIKYRRESSPCVSIAATRQDDGMWAFTVTDEGLGIDAMYFERIFGMFQRLHGREAYSGTGIGLAVCRKIVERHGGVITVSSELGVGSTFRFTLRAKPFAADSQP